MPDETRSGSAKSDAKASNQWRRSRKRSGRNGTRANNVFAAIDLGTNNCRLLIARGNSNNFKVIDSYSRVVKLGAGLESTGRLSEESMDAAVEALVVCARKIKSKRVKRWRCVATEACRKADNGAEFLARVKAESGLTMELISPRVESRLAVMGCIGLVDPSKDVALVVDIGGGSTELSWVDIRKVRDPETEFRVHRPPISAWASLPIGVVTLSEKIPEHSDRETWYADMCNNVREMIEQAGCATRFTKAFEEGRGHLIGTSGTITSLAGIHLKLPYYQRDKVDGLWLRSQDAIAVAKDMASRSPESRALEPCIGEDRAKLLVAGCAITDVLCEMWPSKMIRVADRGLREGILIGLMQEGKQDPKPKADNPKSEKHEPNNTDTAKVIDDNPVATTADISESNA